MQKSRASKPPPKLPSKVRRRPVVQLDLPVILDSPLMKAVHSDRYLLEYPFFDLSKTAKRKRLAFSDGPVTIEVKAIEGQGVATIFDRDMIMYVASLMVQKIEAGENPGRDFVFSGRDFCLVSGRDTGGDSYDLLSKTVERLKGTVIKTNIETGGCGVDGYFS
jgi:plasmid replication initiation protein